MNGFDLCYKAIKTIHHDKNMLSKKIGLFAVCLYLANVCFANDVQLLKENSLSVIGLQAKKGTAAGYVEDQGCKICHSQKWESYQHVGMAKSFAPASKFEAIEAFGKTFYHEPSKRYYRIDQTDQGLHFYRYQLDANKKPINEFDVQIDWVLGSGNRARSYLFQTNWGEIYELPLGWYSEGNQWQMSPGFEFENHLGINRRVQRECLFCHNAFPEVPKYSDHSSLPHRFPKQLPAGTGCQRCHGPGANHIQAVLNKKPLEVIRTAIVNPAKLESSIRDSVCFQCHMLPAAGVAGQRRFGTLDYDFRPGDLLSDYLVHVEANYQKEADNNRFEINHHGYRLWQSDCYQKSQGELGCISCHDPHIKPVSNEFRQSVTTVCKECHNDSFKHEEVNDLQANCVDCHMPTRRTADVIYATMTDHRIARGPFDTSALIAPLNKKIPQVESIQLLPFGHPPEGAFAQVYGLTSIVKSSPEPTTINELAKLLEKFDLVVPEPWLALAKAQHKIKDYSSLLETANLLINAYPTLAQNHQLRGIALFGLGQSKQAIEAYQESLAISALPETHYNLGIAYFSQEQWALAITQFKQAINLRPHFAIAWYYRGLAYEKLTRLESAKEALINSLRFDPSLRRSYPILVKVFKKLGEHDQAIRYQLAMQLNQASAD